MVAGGDDGLPWRRAGRQWLWLPLAIKKGGTWLMILVARCCYVTGVKLTPILLALMWYHTPGVCNAVVSRHLLIPLLLLLLLLSLRYH